MQQIEQRALYNSLRMNWLNDPALAVEPWQVEDYRQLALLDIFERLKRLSIYLDKVSFVAYADVCDSPEELTNYLIGDRQLKADVEDQTYLLVFELWRRLMSEKPSLSLFCDELDYQIYLYDNDQLTVMEPLQDALTNLLTVLDENVDEGVKPTEALVLISSCCANDIEAFLYDFIAEQIEEENDSYAQELLDNFSSYFEGNKWFIFLRIRLLGHLSTKTAHKLLSQVLEDYSEEQDLEFNLELLALMIEIRNLQFFYKLVKLTLPLLKVEEDFQDLLHICVDYYHDLNQEAQKQLIQEILQRRSHRSLTESFDQNDPELPLLLKIFDS